MPASPTVKRQYWVRIRKGLRIAEENIFLQIPFLSKSKPEETRSGDGGARSRRRRASHSAKNQRNRRKLLHEYSPNPQANFWDFLVTFCFNFSVFTSLAEIRNRKASGVPHCADSKCAGKYWSWRIQRRAKCLNPTFRSRNVFDQKWYFVNIFCQFQNSIENLQVVGFRRSTHRWMRQHWYFPAHFESAQYDTF